MIAQWQRRFGWLLLVNSLLGGAAVLLRPNLAPISDLAVVLVGLVGGYALVRQQRLGLAGAAIHYGLQVFAYHSAAIHWVVRAGVALSWVFQLRQSVLVVNLLALLLCIGTLWLAAASRQKPVTLPDISPCPPSN